MTTVTQLLEYIQTFVHDQDTEIEVRTTWTAEKASETFVVADTGLTDDGRLRLDVSTPDTDA